MVHWDVIGDGVSVYLRESKASEEAKSIVEKTKKDLEREHDKAVAELKERAVDLSVAIAAKIIDSSLTAEQQTNLAKQAIKDMESKI